MNNIFNFKRFGLVLSKDFRENRKKYLLQWLTMFGILTVVFMLYSYRALQGNHNPDFNQVFLQMSSFLFLGFGVFFASTSMNSMREKTSRIAYLTMPASNLEKYLSRWLIVTIGFIIFFFIALWMADAVRVVYCHYRNPELDIRFLDFTKLVNPEETINFRVYAFFSKEFFAFCLCLYFFLQSLFILGAAFWQKASFVKTFSAIVVLVILFYFINWGMIKIVHHDFDNFGNQLGPFLTAKFFDFSENIFFLIGACLFIPFTFFNWIVAFFRLRESEIIKRL